MTTRRKFLIAGSAGVCVLAAPNVSVAQPQVRIWRVAFLSQGSRPDSMESHFFAAFPRGMRELGYVEGRNLVIEWRFANDSPERLAGLAADLVQLNVDVIVTAGTPATSAARKATSAIPIVMAGAGDPVGSGFVKSLSRPGGNITGLSNLVIEVGPKRLDMLLSMVPRLSRVAVLMNPDNSSHKISLKNIQAAAQQVGVVIVPLEARNPHEVENAFSEMNRNKTGALIVFRDDFLSRSVGQIAELAARNRLPTMGGLREFPEAGGLMSYGNNPADQYHRAAIYVDKIIKGAKPGDLPVEQPTRLELVINRRTATALGLTIPQSLLISADRVIE